jgi:hypothetical protein
MSLCRCHDPQAKFAHGPPFVAHSASARSGLYPLYSNRTSLKSIAAINISMIGPVRRSGPRV